MCRAVAVDLGASSGRVALGELRDGVISFEVVEQIAHQPIDDGGRLVWDLDKLMSLSRRSVQLAQDKGAVSVGIDSWGVDHGFLDQGGRLVQPPVCYRDLSHVRAFELLEPHRRRLYELTGIQHQPFNTNCQLVARLNEDPDFFKRVDCWLILPDLIGYLLGGAPNMELTQASTTQLLGLDSKWSEEAFSIAGWPRPTREVVGPGRVVGEAQERIQIVSVGSHDTASAVQGFGLMDETAVFLNVGTWSLAGCVLPRPIVSVEAEELGFTNERTVDGRVRFLKNIPGFYFINRLHEELGILAAVPTWLATATDADEVVDLFHPDFFNPLSMLEVCRRQLKTAPVDPQTWAGIALSSLVRAVCSAVGELELLTGRKFHSLRVGGGGSQSAAFCKMLSSRSRLQVCAGPSEATVLGNLATQFVAQGQIADWEAAAEVISGSTVLKTYSGS